MELVNQTPLPVSLTVTKDAQRPGVKMGLLVAKATFAVDARGAITLVAADPFPVENDDVPTELGLMPRDTIMRAGTELEVLLLGAAYAPRPVTEMTVSLAIADRANHLAVTGDRYWTGAGPGARPSEPAPFTRMPLTWERAFGGSADVALDAHTVIEVCEPRNPFGRGFDPEPMARGLAAEMGVPAGYPRYEQLRALPNVEHPRERVTAFDDRPEPHCWAPRPVTMIRPAGDDEALRRVAAAAREAPSPRFYRTTREMILAAAPLGAPVRVAGVLPSGRDFVFALPNMTVFADYVLGKHGGTKTLVPQVLVLLPEQARFYIVFRMDFLMKAQEDDARSLRLRLA
jgi:hypothetical protein